MHAEHVYSVRQGCSVSRDTISFLGNLGSARGSARRPKMTGLAEAEIFAQSSFIAMSHPPLSLSNPVDVPLRGPGQLSSNPSENDSLPKSTSSSPREIVRRVVERTSDKLGRNKSVGSKPQRQSPKSQRSSIPGSPKRFISLSRKGKERQTSSAGDSEGTYILHLFIWLLNSCFRRWHFLADDRQWLNLSISQSGVFANQTRHE